MLVSLTHHSYITVISLTLGQPFHGSRTVLSLPDTLINIRRFVHLVIAGDRLRRSPPQLMLQVVVVILSTRLIRV